MERKKFVIVGLLLLFSLALVGCSSSEEAEVSNPPANQSQTTANGSESEEKESKPDDFPNKEIEIIVPSNPGGSLDTTARAIAEVGARPEYFGVPIVVRNNPGGNMTFGPEKMMQADADGYTLHVGGDSAWTTTPLTMDVGYDPEKDITYLGRVNVMYSGWGVPADSPFETVTDLLEYVKEHPGEVSMGVGGGTFQVWQDILEKNGYVFNNVAFEGGPQIGPQLAGGHIDVGGISTTVAKPLIDSGEVRLLFWGPVIEGKEPPLEGVPGMNEYPELAEIEPHAVYVGVTIRSEVPDERKQFIEETLERIAQDEDFQKLIKQTGGEPIWVDSETYTQEIKKISAQMKELYGE
jgi:tripartite-type tricarboxylate transporter receptor subunit TctC